METAEIIKSAFTLCLFDERLLDDVEYQLEITDMFNQLLKETLRVNNVLRRRKGFSSLRKVPQILSLKDPLPYETELYIPFCYGLAAKLLTSKGRIRTLTLSYNRTYINSINAIIETEEQQKREERQKFIKKRKK